MDNLSVLIGGKAGDGINQAGLIIARILSQLGYRIYIYFDYPSLIRGGHNFSIIRAAKEKIATHQDEVDFILALNQDSIDLHKNRVKKGTSIIYDSDTVRADGVGIPLGKITKEENGPPITRNSSIIGAFLKAANIEWEILENVFRKNIPKETELNLKIARRGYDEAKDLAKIERIPQERLPLFTGNEAIGLGLIKGGLAAYIAYPMTPSSSLLHFMAQKALDFDFKVIHPESEIGVMLMAEGFAYAGQKVAVGTSGGGFCLMTEGLSLTGMAEVPVVIVMGQRPGPSTGVPTYTAQGDLHFVLSAGQGEFVRFVVAPGDTEEAYLYSQIALNISWKYQIPSIILSDKTLSEGAYSFDINLIKDIKEKPPLLWDKKDSYKRYLDTKTGISPLCFPPHKDAVVKANSYAHDEYGITTEDPQSIAASQDKRMRKEKFLIEELEDIEPVKVYGKKDASSALLCWGSNKGVCIEIAETLGLRVIQPLVLSPFPVKQFKEALKGVKKVICVECNSTGQLARLISTYGFNVDEKILKYDGRPFSLDDLEGELKGIIK